MKKPSAVLFDFGGTLALDSEFDLERGVEYLRKIALNGDSFTTTEICGVWNGLYADIKSAWSKDAPFAIETPLSSIFRCIFGIAGLKFDIDLVQLEHLFDSNNSDRTQTPYMAQLLEYLDKNNIKTGVISNITLTGEALRRSIELLYPGNRFEFVITSADYCLTKPSPYMFLAAAKRLCVVPSDCFYCGDSLRADVAGALNSGVFPVLYDPMAKQAADYSDKGEYLKINSWKVLKDLLDEV
ncbi:MAG: flavin mononucleotide phosphatase [Firmicutes bacterium ADurb.Bin300]|nr:MAG: flavin mononucleotide phosphatase [Firmicutes bacterium ADurb.Bin300]HOD02325.1 HAD family hydrolase [Clostridiales bacterium]